MLKYLLLRILVLQILNGVLGERSCNDCIAYHSCSSALYHAKYKQNEDETRNLFTRANCGMENLIGMQVHKVCCSDFPQVHKLSKIQNRFLDTTINKSLLPDKCGSILGNRIVGGQKAKLYEFPWMALISYKTRDGLEFKCGGTIINSKYILTAAHCVVGQQIAGVRLGEHDINTAPDCEYENDKVICENHIQDMPVKEIISHEYFQKSPTKNDIALIRVDGTILFNYTNVAPICLPVEDSLRNNVLDGKYGVIAGWGHTETGQPSSVLLRAEVPVRTMDACKGIYNINNSNDINKQFCAGELNKDCCNGDSGGPFMLKEFYNDRNSYVQYGIVSHGPSNCSSEIPAVYTDVREYADWLLKNIKE